MTQDELRAHFSEKLREEQGESKPRDEQEDNRQEPEPLNVSEGEEKEEVPANEEEIRIGKTTRKNSGNSIVPDMSRTANAMRKIPKA